MKIIFVTGGVLSGLGKGISASAMGAVLESGGKRVFMQKLDGYLNVDPGTMSPYQHGEVFVTEDGSETDLDLGHYERFIDHNLTGLSSFTAGQLYEEIINRERNGEYLGKTVQIIPHLTDLVKEKIITWVQESNADIAIVEIGGTVGDMENEFLLEAARQMRHEYGSQNILFAHLTLLPYLEASKELKTKPTQHSVRQLMGYGIMPDILMLRTEQDLPEDIRKKVASMCGLQESYVLPAPNLSSIYEVPLAYFHFGLGELLSEKLNLRLKRFDMSKWKELKDNRENAKKEKRIAMVGKYGDLEDAYYSLNEGLRIAGYEQGVKVRIDFVDATKVEEDPDILTRYDGICIPGGFGSRGIEGMITAAKYARENAIPYLGICLGSQIMAIEFARNVLGIPDAHSEEFSPDGKNNVVHIMETQKGIYKKGGTMRLGSYPCKLVNGSLARDVYGESRINERHRHRFEFNNAYREQMQNAGFIISGTSPDGELVEMVEIENHPFMIACQFHPEFKSRPTHSHPLFYSYISAL